TTSAPQLVNFSWSADNLSAGATGVTYTFNYEIVTADPYNILYVINNNGWELPFLGLSGNNYVITPTEKEDVTVRVNGSERDFNVRNWSTGLMEVRLTDPIVASGSQIEIIIENVTNKNVGTHHWTWIRTATAGGHEIDGVVSPDPIVLSANTAPIVDANTGLTVTEGTTGTIDSGKLHFNDDETEDDTQLTATITTAVAHGTLFLDANLNNTFDAGDEQLTVSATFTQDDVNNYLLRYTNTADNQTSDSFVFTVSDPDGGELTNQTFNITINQVPTVTVNNGLTLNEGTTELIDSGKLNATDAETGGGTDITFTITSAVSHGILFIDSNPSNIFDAGDVELVENATFTLDDVNNDRLRYTNTVNDQTTDSFEFKVSDPDGGELT